MEVEPRIARAIVGALRERDRSGHEIWRWLGPVHGASTELTEANLYPTLYALEASGLIESHWREGETIRRAYRLAGGGLETALANAWGPIARRRSTADIGGEGGWNFDLPARGRSKDAPEASEPPEAAEEREAAEPPDPPRPAQVGESEPLATVRAPRTTVEEMAEKQIEGYVEALSAALAIDDLHRRDVCIEIGDHLHDSMAEYRSLGNEIDDAAACAVEQLGAPDELAAAIGRAQFSRKRLESGLRWGSAVATLALLASFAILLCALFLVTPFLFFAVHVAIGLAGVDAYLPNSTAVDEAQVLLPAAIAAFVAARRSITHVALRSRRAEPALRATWAAVGFVPLAVVALIVPISNDPVTIACTVAMPFCWVAGCLRPVRLSGDLVTPAGSIAVVAVLVAGLATPGLHLWAYHRDALPPAAPPALDLTGIRAVWTTKLDQPVWTVAVSGIPPGWSLPRIEVWRTVRAGFSIGPDQAETAPVYVVDAGLTLDFRNVPEAGDSWWVLLTATGPDGVRRTIYGDIRPGASQPHHASLVRWVLTGG